MFMRTGFRNQRELIDHLKSKGMFTDERVEVALNSVDRADFTRIDPYCDVPQSIGFGATISAPHMHAYALDKLVTAIKPASHILDVGSGSGYLAACLAKMVGEKGKVVGVEHIEELVDLSIRNVRKHNADLLDSGRLVLVAGDGRRGYPDAAPYDAIHVGAAARELPQTLVDQLAVGGRMVIPVEFSYGQEFIQVDKISPNEVRQTKIVPVAYVPLTDRSAQLNN